MRYLWCLCLALVALNVPAQDYPNRPIRIYVPAAPGGTTDKQQVVVENRASASGVIAGELTAKAPPDGYTLLLAYHQHTINGALSPNLPYHPVNDFTPITQLTRAGLLLVVHPDSPPRTLQEFVAWTKKRSGELNFGSAGLGSGGHLAGELYNQMAHVKAQHIPYKGSGPALVDLIGGRYDYNFAGIQAAQPHVHSGKLRGLAVTTPQRVAAMPDVPAVAEAIPGYEVVGWYGVIGPAGMPAPLVERLHHELLRVLAQPDVHERIVNDGSEPVGNSPREFRDFMAADLAKWAKVVKESGAKFE
ncbi:MAG: tripartite tricarboxylate transporter substrate binding protein [Betaproteobacteria bacterium]|nr:tripartite tricarboxylate transporter substrate binding protein [Betaproteobacteria bacterium]